MISATMDISPSVLAKNLSNVSYSPFLSFCIPKLSINSVSLQPGAGVGSVGMAVGHTE